MQISFPRWFLIVEIERFFPTFPISYLSLGGSVLVSSNSTSVVPPVKPKPLPTTGNKISKLNKDFTISRRSKSVCFSTFFVYFKIIKIDRVRKSNFLLNKSIFLISFFVISAKKIFPKIHKQFLIFFLSDFSAFIDQILTAFPIPNPNFKLSGPMKDVNLFIFGKWVFLKIIFQSFFNFFISIFC